jgi:ABC-type antimicrobial peptide transport system permease subunit
MDAANLQVRAGGRPEALSHAVTEAIHRIEPAMPVYGVRTMEQAVNGINGLQLYAIGAALATAMGVVGLLLAIVGVYGVISYSVAQREQEIGIRVALGARPAEILRLVSREGLGMVAAGLVFGLAATFGVSRLLAAFLTCVSDTDPVTYVGVAGCLGLVAKLASYIPARRAARVDPMEALRHS